jgi:hypothetical protein
VVISRPAPSNSLALFNDNPRKLYIDLRQLALYNIVMKKRNTFDITKYNKECKLRQVAFRMHARIAIRHPLTWLLIMIAIAYGFEL